MIDIEYANAYAEVLEILQYVKAEDYNKIPSEKINFFMENENLNYYFRYNPKLTFEEQEISEKTKYILANLFCEYWATDSQKEMINNKRLQDYEIEESNKRKFYNPDQIFKNKQAYAQTAENNNINEKEINLIPYKESIIKKIIKHVIKLLKK